MSALMFSAPRLAKLELHVADSLLWILTPICKQHENALCNRI